ncbi:gas vesicle protein [Roseivivax halodurans JCM 10272]|uniref:Gas vesicle protein n=1 Tax=Roseivivax halodurans JCM 10272 TaxID=1449350 RepID=X7EIC4_9RHOB|nr:gas vesicle protein GvpJ [Roseivivax halodurans]ETX15864.1 gas vesicle protein [Roseivivax halodurans JCM 10272]
MPDGFEMRLVGPDEALASRDGRLVDLLDGLLDQGVVLRGEAWISVADVDLVFLGLDLVLANPDRICGREGRT